MPCERARLTRLWHAEYSRCSRGSRALIAIMLDRAIGEPQELLSFVPYLTPGYAFLQGIAPFHTRELRVRYMLHT